MADRRRQRAYTCRAHGPFHAVAYLHEAPRCPCGCSPYFVRHADGSPIEAKPLPPPKPEPQRPPPPAPDELMPPDEVRTSLKRLLAQAPQGGKRPIALALGFRGRWALHSLRSIARGHGYLFEAMRRRLSRGVQQLERGDIALIPTGHHGGGKRLFTVAQTVAGRGYPGR